MRRQSVAATALWLTVISPLRPRDQLAAVLSCQVRGDLHDGRFGTLEEVIEHYATGVKRTATLDPNLAKHPDGGVPLSDADKKALIAFLRILTDERLRSRTSSE